MRLRISIVDSLRRIAAGFVLGSVLALPGAMAVAQGEKAVLEIGVLPYVGLTELVKAYGPLATFLEKELDRPVRVVTARGYPDYLRKSLAGNYPLVVTASHFGRLMELEAGYVPALRPPNTFHIHILVRENSSRMTLADLKNARIATPGALAQTAIMGRGILGRQDIRIPAANYIDAGSHKGALLAVQNGEADACFVSEGAFRHMKEEERKGMRAIGEAESAARSAIPVIYAIGPDVAPADRELWVRLMMRFANETPEGRDWNARLKYDGLRPPTREDMKSLDADVAELRQIVGPDLLRR